MNTKDFYCMQRFFYHWKNVAEQSLEMLSATFIAKFHVSALSTSTARDSPCLNGLFTPPNMLATSLQYQNSLVSPRTNNSFIKSPMKSSTPLLSFHSTKRSSHNNDNFNGVVANSPSRDDVKRQLFTEDKQSKLSPPCKCLNSEVINQLSSLQQDLDSIHMSESFLHQHSNVSVSSNSSITELSENIISPPIEFSEQCYADSHNVSVSSVGTKSLYEISRIKPVMIDNSVSELSVSHDSSFVLYNKMVYIIKIMQLYPASVAFIAWHKFVLKMKSLRAIQNEVQHLSCQNSVRHVFMLWKSQTCRSLEYKQIETSFLANQRKRILCGSLLKWTTLHLRHTRTSYILNDYLSSKNNYLVKRYFAKWKCNFEMNLRIRNHMVNTVMQKYYTIMILFCRVVCCYQGVCSHGKTTVYLNSWFKPK